MTTDEKTMLLQHESLFIQKKMADAGLASVIMLQIPRILYDLFNLHRTHTGDTRSEVAISEAIRSEAISEAVNAVTIRSEAISEAVNAIIKRVMGQETYAKL
jgi:hypothetical protein